MDVATSLELSFPSNYNTGIIVVDGIVSINEGDAIEVDHYIRMANDGEAFSVNSKTKVTLLLMSGEPIGEPIAAQGPFVMNTKAEIMQAMRDFYEGKFGHLN
jgi:redox-sensitive bicupin YhaK (pirin superfamily)